VPRAVDPIKIALADLVFAMVIHALQEMPRTPLEPAHEPLEDCVIEVTPYSDTEAMVRVAGLGTVQWYTIAIRTHHNT
jgi:hypothetical protein